MNDEEFERYQAIVVRYTALRRELIAHRYDDLKEMLTKQYCHYAKDPVSQHGGFVSMLDQIDNLARARAKKAVTFESEGW